MSLDKDALLRAKQEDGAFTEQMKRNLLVDLESESEENAGPQDKASATSDSDDSSKYRRAQISQASKRQRVGANSRREQPVRDSPRYSSTYNGREGRRELTSKMKEKDVISRVAAAADDEPNIRRPGKSRTSAAVEAASMCVCILYVAFRIRFLACTVRKVEMMLVGTRYAHTVCIASRQQCRQAELLRKAALACQVIEVNDDDDDDGGSGAAVGLGATTAADPLADRKIRVTAKIRGKMGSQESGMQELSVAENIRVSSPLASLFDRVAQHCAGKKVRCNQLGCVMPRARGSAQRASRPKISATCFSSFSRHFSLRLSTK